MITDREGAGVLPFESLYRHGFARVAVAVPSVRVADPAYNAEQTLGSARQAAAAGAVLTVFPELGLSSYTADDLFHSDALDHAVDKALRRVVDESAAIASVLVVGAPIRAQGRLFNCGIVIHRGRVLGAAPKSYLPNYREFYEKRQFAAAREALDDRVTIAGQRVPFGAELLFAATNLSDFVFHLEVCEDGWVPLPPSGFAALAGATVLVNLSASNIVVGKADYRRQLCASHSAQYVAAYLYSAAGHGESTTDMAFDGQALVCENGELLAEGERFADHPQLVTADIDLRRLAADRLRTTSFADTVHDHRERLARFRRVEIELPVPTEAVPLRRDIPRFPYVPADPAVRNERCAEVHHIQVEGLSTRLAATGSQHVVIGVSGGLDSTVALIVAAKTMDRLGLPRSNVLAYTMPGFATGSRTRTDAHRLMAALGVSAHEIDIRPSATQMLRDLNHPAAEGVPQYDVTYENVQAGERTSHLFRLANRHRALVVGTGDLSELALGWCTFGVGDHMAHYSVNASVPKTLIKYLIAWAVDTGDLGPEAGAVLTSILATEISPELVPTDETGAEGDSAQPGQSSEATVGPYELQDLHLYYLLRFGYLPSRIAYLAHHAWSDRTRGHWPDLIPVTDRHEYDLPTIKRWLAEFLRRFVQTSQFKRSTLPNAPKVGSGGSLSPRGDWRAPSDAVATAWLDELERNVP
ncbi:NAD(+) synthase [Nocardia terpenica]|uniref:NAD(+) synthase n=1 Tax=Nocardia terpenica TaxID=455432 RepID=UPI0009ECCC50|nr:NAD(+) synthase [Nocardia terpenica]MBF6059657.1 NAD(+) synthase [Nocardia terpenica]MBF6102802.1 NAD(+) synthase [Nocardia terpenica]MBF6111007.1 NAD(+) synthase [Nocardia terpenica]MBF6117138.1 NAD(+) synthase [Nocardia terpenica]MBF6151022.1 NAD(+) synthase [Nocardia terpenica]